MVVRSLLNSMLYFPARELHETPAAAGLTYRDLWFETSDSERLHAWWVDHRGGRPAGHVLLCHGNGGNIGDRVLHASVLADVGFDVLLFDYRGYGRSSGRPDEEGTYRDARAARACLLEQPGVDPSRVVYLGESLGGAVALELAVAEPPAGLALMCTFTSVRAMARRHYGIVPPALVPDVYPSLSRVGALNVPLLVLHGDRDEIVPLAHGQELFEAAPEPKRMRVLEGVGHNDLMARAGREVAREVEEWVAGLGAPD